MKQTTLRAEVRCSGIGLHSGKKVGLVIKPAPAHTGIVFSVTTASGPFLFAPSPYKVLSTGLATTIGDEHIKISTVEHLLATFVGLEIDNAIVEVDGSEIPIMDGSAAAFVYLCNSVGIRHLHAQRKIAKIIRPLIFENGEKRIEALPFNGLRIDYKIKFAHSNIGEQSFSFIANASDFANKIGRCRTFGFLKDVEMLQKNGLALGGSLDNAVVFDDYGVVNPDGLRYSDEMVRHKILDFMGDIGIANIKLQGHFRIACSGHDFNNKFLQYLFDNQATYLETVDREHIASSRKEFAPFDIAVPAWA